MRLIRPQRGNILFLILLAAVLFAALSYAVTSGMRGGGNNASAEKAQLDAAAMQNYEAQINAAVMRLKTVNGCTDAQISYETPSGATVNPSAPMDKHCHVFSPLGAGASYMGTALGVGCSLSTMTVGQTCNGIMYVGDVSGHRVFTTLSDSGQTTYNNGGTNDVITGATSLNNGMVNTNLLVGLTDTGAPYLAAVMCRNLGPEWYLPAQQELGPLYTYRTALGMTGVYLGSREYSQGGSGVKSMDSGGEATFAKNYLGKVRCVRSI